MRLLLAAAILGIVGGCGDGSSDPDGDPTRTDDAPAGTPQAGVDRPDAADDEPGGAATAPEGVPGDAPDAPADDADGLPIDPVNGFRVAVARDYDADGRLVYAEETRVDPTGREALVSGSYTRDDGSRVEFTDRLTVDEAGRLVRSEYTEPDPEDPSFDFVANVDYEHDAEGRLTIRASGSPNRETSIGRFEWDGDRLLRASERPGEAGGRLVEYRYEGDSSLPVGKRTTFWRLDDAAPDDPFPADEPEVVSVRDARTFTWEGPGRMLENRIDVDDDGTVDEIGTYEYDADGNMVGVTFVDAAGLVLVRREYEYVPVEFPFYNYWLRVFRFFP